MTVNNCAASFWGIKHHNLKAKKTKSEQDYKICCECFDAHANLGNKMAIKNLKNPDLPFNKKELQQDKERGIEYLKLSALQDNSKAIETLNKYRINL
ncbi:hypothetical protein RhiirA5_439759 [Rhizophagus irregularis]|uniref:Uncharacterized protein n=1 Tax=Rhizophagus irregularis TaxID=588596 RepID=A0A2N0NHJ9_9GLOM|nr:hypothetical protein RhiirA5_439759 [Rhizophagus irregularis]